VNYAVFRSFMSVLPSSNVLELEMKLLQLVLSLRSNNHWSSFFKFLDSSNHRSINVFYPSNASEWKFSYDQYVDFLVDLSSDLVPSHNNFFICFKWYLMHSKPWCFRTNFDL